MINLPSKDSVREVALPAFDALPASTHLLDRASALALQAALVAKRPLLLRGDPGTGKSQLARAAAVLLNRDLLVHVVDARTEPHDLLYTVDALSRLAQAQLAGAGGATKAAARESLDVLQFVHPGRLWWAYDRASARAQASKAHAAVPPGLSGDEARGAVLLIDEIDKADASVPNALLDAFGSARFEVEGRETVEAKEPRPLVILTTNEERALPDAFVRRCLVLTLSLPTDKKELAEYLVARGRANVGNAEDAVLARAAAILTSAREDAASNSVTPPGLAEYIDLVRVVTELAKGRKAITLLDEVAHLATRKHPEMAVR